MDTNDLIKIKLMQGAKAAMTNKAIYEKEITSFKNSRRRLDMINGELYFKGEHDILTHKRTAIGAGGELITLDNLPNARIVDNQYKKMVNQKTNYLLGQPITVRTENDTYSKLLQVFFDKRFMRLMKGVGRDALNGGLGWIFVCYDEEGQLVFKRLKPYEMIPGWKDADHTQLEYCIRIYEVISYEGQEEKIIEKVEIFEPDGISYFTFTDGQLVPEEPYHQPYFTVMGEDEKEVGYNWRKIPLIPFKYNSDEIPLLKNVKSLQDGLNLILSTFSNNMQEDARNTILVLVNYDGENLGEFRRNLATYGAVKVKTTDGAAGDLKTLTVEVNAENYKAILELFKKAIIENAMGYDAKDDRLSGQPNQMNIQSMYSDIDLDANEMETEFQAAFEELLWFVDCHLSNTGKGDYEMEPVEVIFNRDILINEGEAIDNIMKSVGLLSEETLIAQHPWVDDLMLELERIKKERATAEYDGAFQPMNGGEPDANE